MWRACLSAHTEFKTKYEVYSTQPPQKATRRRKLGSASCFFSMPGQSKHADEDEDEDVDVDGGGDDDGARRRERKRERRESWEKREREREREKSKDRLVDEVKKK